MIAAVRSRFAGRTAVKRALWSYLAELMGALRWKVAAAMALSLLISLTEGISLVMLVPMLQIVGLDVGHGAVGQLSMLTSRFLGAVGLQPTLSTILILYVLIVTTRAFLSRYSVIIGFTLQQQLVVWLRQRLYRAITNADWLFFSRSRSSDFTHALTSELNRIGGATSTLLGLFTSVILTLVYLGLALVVSPLMTLLVIVSGTTLLLALYRKTQLGRLQGKEVTQDYKQILE